MDWANETFSLGLASGATSDTSTPLPTTLNNVQVKDAAGNTRNAPLFYVSLTQINFQAPADTSPGSATVNVLLNQANILISRSLAGRGSVDRVLTVDGIAANTVTINIK